MEFVVSYTFENTSLKDKDALRKELLVLVYGCGTYAWRAQMYADHFA